MSDEAEAGLAWHPDHGGAHYGCPYFAAIVETTEGTSWFCNKCLWSARRSSFSKATLRSRLRRALRRPKARGFRA